MISERKGEGKRNINVERKSIEPGTLQSAGDALTTEPNQLGLFLVFCLNVGVELDPLFLSPL